MTSERNQSGEGGADTPLLLSDYDYELPDERIAQTAAEPRDSARLLTVPLNGGPIAHYVFRELSDLLLPGDLLVVNETRVSAVRLPGSRASGGSVEALLLRPALEVGPDCYDALVRPGNRIREGDTLTFEEAGLSAEVVRRTADGGRTLRFRADQEGDVTSLLETRGRVPLPPYITTPLKQPERYQTVYARTPGSAAAPTAGLHFTSELLTQLGAKGIGMARVRLDVGLGTFRPIKVEDARKHEMHHERFAVGVDAARQINQCQGRVIAVGTTVARSLETAARVAEPDERVGVAEGDTDIFLYPGHRFRAVDGLITNFHQPHSSLLLLVAAFIGRERMREVYATALREQYRFLSFGDAMLAL